MADCEELPEDDRNMGDTGHPVKQAMFGPAKGDPRPTCASEENRSLVRISQGTGN